jgi:hypothetical protein
VNKAISELSTVTQRIAANSEESAAASEEMLACCDQSKGHVEGMVTLVRGKNGQLQKLTPASDLKKSLGNRGMSSLCSPTVSSTGKKKTEEAPAASPARLAMATSANSDEPFIYLITIELQPVIRRGIQLAGIIAFFWSAKSSRVERTIRYP